MKLLNESWSTDVTIEIDEAGGLDKFIEKTRKELNRAQLRLYKGYRLSPIEKEKIKEEIADLKKKIEWASPVQNKTLSKQSLIDNIDRLKRELEIDKYDAWDWKKYQERKIDNYKDLLKKQYKYDYDSGESITESKNPLKDAAIKAKRYNKKHKANSLWFFPDREKGIGFFNRANTPVAPIPTINNNVESNTDSGVSEGEGMAEQLKINIRESLNNWDKEDYRDYVNMYQSLILNEEQKKDIVKLISENKKEDTYNYLSKLVEDYESDFFNDDKVCNIKWDMNESLKEDKLDKEVSATRRDMTKLGMKPQKSREEHKKFLKALKDKEENKNLKEEYGAYKDEPYCEEIADRLIDGFWNGYTRNDTEWELEINGMPRSEFKPSFADWLAEEVSYPVRDGHLDYMGLDMLLYKNSIPGFHDSDDAERLIPDLITLGVSREDIDAWLKDTDEDAELEFWIDYDTNFDVDEWEDNNASEDDLGESLKEDVEEEVFTPEEQEEFEIDETGHSLEGYDQYHHCGWCGEIWPESEIKKELNMGWLCRDCRAALYSRGEKGVYEESLKEDKENQKAKGKIIITPSGDYAFFFDDEARKLSDILTLNTGNFKGLFYMPKGRHQYTTIPVYKLKDYKDRIEIIDMPKDYKKNPLEEDYNEKLYGILMHSDMTDITFALIGNVKEKLEANKNSLWDIIDGGYYDVDENGEHIVVDSEQIINRLKEEGITFVDTESCDPITSECFFYNENEDGLIPKTWYFGKTPIEIISYESSRF